MQCTRYQVCAVHQIGTIFFYEAKNSPLQLSSSVLCVSQTMHLISTILHEPQNPPLQLFGSVFCVSQTMHLISTIFDASLRISPQLLRCFVFVHRRLWYAPHQRNFTRASKSPPPPTSRILFHFCVSQNMRYVPDQHNFTRATNSPPEVFCFVLTCCRRLYAPDPRNFWTRLKIPSRLFRFVFVYHRRCTRSAQLHASLKIPPPQVSQTLLCTWSAHALLPQPLNHEELCFIPLSAFADTMHLISTIFWVTAALRMTYFRSFVRFSMSQRQRLIVLRGNIVIRTCDQHKNLYIPLFLLTIFGPDYYVPR